MKRENKNVIYSVSFQFIYSTFTLFFNYSLIVSQCFENDWKPEYAAVTSFW